MGRKIFVSYKYWDSDVYVVPNITVGVPKVRDYVSWLEKKFTERSDHIYKGEHDDEDLSFKSEDYIWSSLKDKIYDSSITIVLISPNMKEKYKWERSQWIPWEISHSLRETTRSNFKRHSNAVLAVILPDKYNNYDYYDSLNKFEILSENIKCGYIPIVKLDLFKYNCDYYIEKAYKAQKETPRYKIKISL
nr:TIR domain-containing protein [uncultured Clostridium sp.]